MINWLKRRYPRLPVVRELLRLNEALVAANIAHINSFIQSELTHSPRYRDPRKLNHYEHQVFSQCDEDGIVAEIFRRIGTKDRFFVEFGVGNGIENNTVFLLMQNWRGAWIEGDAASAAELQSRFRGPLSEGRLKFLQSFITTENIEALFNQLNIPAEFDLLSVDIDRNTYHVWKALGRFKPRVLVIEYNSTFPADVEWIAEYDSQRVWNNSMYFGASLKAYERLASSMGYALVGCNFAGTNAFFVRNTERLELFADPFTAENHYEPPRYWLTRRQAHFRCFDDRT